MHSEMFHPCKLDESGVHVSGVLFHFLVYFYYEFLYANGAGPISRECSASHSEASWFA